MQNVQADKNSKKIAEPVRVEGEINKAELKTNSRSAEINSTQNSNSQRSTRKRTKVDHSLSVQENEIDKDPVIDDASSYKDDGKGKTTPQNPVKSGLVDDSNAPGDVSVTFLASTPKPGRPQLSRRRPMSPVRETSDMPLHTNTTAASKEKTTTGNVSSASRKQGGKETSSLSPRKATPEKRAAGSSIKEMIASSNKSRLENKRKRLTVNSISNKSDNDSSARADKSENLGLIVTGSSAKRSKVSVPVNKVSARGRGLDRKDLTANRQNLVEKSLTEINTVQSRSRNESSVRNRNAQTSKTDVDSGPRVQKENISKGRHNRSVAPDDNDVTVRNSARLRLSGHDRKAAVNQRLQALSRNEQSLPDQTLIMWETEGKKRTRTDLIDLDVVLNTMTETLSARMDVYDADEEQSAVRLLEKYLTQDITHMINGVQSVADLQSKIKKSGQSIKQKQKSLMSLQKQRVELEEKCQTAKENQKKNENMVTINQFLKDLGRVIDMC